MRRQLCPRARDPLLLGALEQPGASLRDLLQDESTLRHLVRGGRHLEQDLVRDPLQIFEDGELVEEYVVEEPLEPVHRVLAVVVVPVLGAALAVNGEVVEREPGLRVALGQLQPILPRLLHPPPVGEDLVHDGAAVLAGDPAHPRALLE